MKRSPYLPLPPRRCPTPLSDTLWRCALVAMASMGGSAARAGRPPHACIALNACEQAFFDGVAHLGQAQVALGKLAVAHAGRTDVRRLAQQTVNACIRMRAQLATLAEAKGVVLPTQALAPHRDEHAALAALEGVPFDHLYLDLQARAHNELTVLFVRQAQGEGDRQLTTWAQNALPQLEAHGRRLAAVQRATAPAQLADEAP